MANKAKTPKRRFSCFKGEWEQRTLGDFFSERSERANGDEELLSVTIANGVIRQIDSDKRNTASEDKRNYKVVKKGDVPYNSMRMWQGAVGTSAYDGIVSPAYTVLSPKDNANGKFFMELFKKESTLEIFKRWSQGLTSDTWNLKYPVLSTIAIAAPSVEEQAKIADYIKSIDNLINLQQQKIDKLSCLKKAYLFEMFPAPGEKKPRRRFSGFTDDWEQRKVGDVTQELTEYTTVNSNLPLLTSSRSGILYQSEYRDSITTRNEETLFSVVPVNACTYRHMSDDDTFHLNINHLEKGLVSREYPVFVGKNSNLGFVVRNINSSAKFLKFCKEQKKGGTRTRLYYKNLCNFELQIPSIEEQNKIEGYFSELDNLITLHQRKLDKLNFLKKAYLSEMFV